MKFENSCVIPVGRKQLWDFVTDIPKVAKCVSGVEEVREIGGGRYGGILTLKVGLVKLRMAGTIILNLVDAENYVAAMSLEAADERVNGTVQGKMMMKLEEIAPDQTKLIVDTGLNLFGKIGEFGQPIIGKKADQMMSEFAANVAKAVGSHTQSDATSA